MNYDLFPASFVNIEAAGRMGSRQREALWRKHVRIIPARLEQMASITDISWLYSGAPLQSDMPSFEDFCQWMSRAPIWEKRPKRRPRSQVYVLDLDKRKDIIRIEKERQEEGEQSLSAYGESIIADVGIAISEYVRVRYPWGAWTVDDRRSSLTRGQPCVGWFGGALNLGITGRQQAYVAIARAREGKNSISQKLRELIQELEKIAATPGDRIAALR